MDSTTSWENKATMTPSCDSPGPPSLTPVARPGVVKRSETSLGRETEREMLGDE